MPASLLHGVRGWLTWTTASPTPNTSPMQTLGLDGARDGQVLGEGAGLERAAEHALPVRVVVERVDADGLVHPAVVHLVGLPVAVETMGAEQGVRDGTFGPACLTTSGP